MESFRRNILDTFAGDDLDALVFPANTPLGAQTQCPGVSVPSELTEDGLPVGVELLGKPYHEHELIEMAYAYEQVADTRESPEVAPPLSSE